MYSSFELFVTTRISYVSFRLVAQPLKRQRAGVIGMQRSNRGWGGGVTSS